MFYEAIVNWRKRNTAILSATGIEVLRTGTEIATEDINSEEYICTEGVIDSKVAIVKADDSAESDGPFVSSNEYGECSYTTAATDASIERPFLTEPRDKSTAEAHQSSFVVREESYCTAFSTITLLALLNANEEGKDLIEKAKAGERSEANQLKLAGTVAGFHLKNRNKLRTEDLEVYARAITTVFESEEKVHFLNLF